MHRSSSCCIAVQLAFCLLLVPTIASAQSTTAGSISGRVLDQTHARVPACAITLTNLDTGDESRGTSSADGSFRFLEVRPGTYSLQVEREGFALFLDPRITVEVGRVTTLQVRLAIAARHESVSVNDEVGAVNTTQAGFSTNINQFDIDNLPINGRRWSDFALLTPTATPDGDYGLISFNGISGTQNNSTIDGGDNNQAFFGEERGRTRISYVISQASVREFQVSTHNYSAEYGRSAGASINAVTRSGSNKTRGQVFYYLRDSALGATNPFSLRPTENPNGTYTTTKIKPEDRRQQFGFSIGGPIVRDRLFYFFTWDMQRRDYPAVAAARNPAMLFSAPSQSELNRIKVVMPYGTTQAQLLAAWQSGMDYLAGLLGEVPRTGNHNIFFPKLDYKIDSRNTLSASYNRMRWYSIAGVQSSPVVQRGADSFGNDGVKVDTFVAHLHSVLNRNAVNELRFTFARDFQYESPQTPAPGEPATGPYGNVPSIAVERSWDGFTFGMPNSLPRAALPDEYRLQGADSVSWLLGHHLLKAGLDLNRVHDRMDNLYAGGGSYNYKYRDSFIADLLQWQHWGEIGWPGSNIFIHPNYGYSTYTQGFGNAVWKFTTMDSAYFLQDDWRVARRLLLSFGLRYERQALPSPQAPNPLLPLSARFPEDNNNFGPRFGFVWDVTGRGTTSLRGGYGLYYGRILNSTISSALDSTGMPSSQRTYTYYGYRQSGSTGLRFPYYIASDPYSVNNEGDVAVFGPHTQLPQIHKANLTLEQQVGKNTVVSASYLLTLGRELTNFVDTNFDPNSVKNVTYTFANDTRTNAPGPFSGTLTVPVVGRRLNPRFEAVTNITSNINSNYNALVVGVRRRMSSGLQFNIHYTWSHALDDGQSSTTFTTRNNTLFPFPFTYTYNGKTVSLKDPDYGNSNFDIRHRVTGTVVWEPRPVRNEKHQLARVLDHWSISPIFRFATGRPFSEYIDGDTSNDCAECFGYLGTGGESRLPFLGRNSFRHPDTWNVDLRLARRFHIAESQSLRMMIEAFNVMNHLNATGVADQLYELNGTKLNYSPGFGKVYQAGNAVYRERQMQIALRYDF